MKEENDRGRGGERIEWCECRNKAVRNVGVRGVVVFVRGTPCAAITMAGQNREVGRTTSCNLANNFLPGKRTRVPQVRNTDVREREPLFGKRIIWCIDIYHNHAA
jgi:hypothetical protein